jgi:hypothetical protein
VIRLGKPSQLQCFLFPKKNSVGQFERLGVKLNRPSISDSHKCYSDHVYYCRAVRFMTLHVRPVDSEKLLYIYMGTFVGLQIKAVRQNLV